MTAFASEGASTPVKTAKAASAVLATPPALTPPPGRFGQEQQRRRSRSRSRGATAGSGPSPAESCSRSREQGGGGRRRSSRSRSRSWRRRPWRRSRSRSRGRRRGGGGSSGRWAEDSRRGNAPWQDREEASSKVYEIVPVRDVLFTQDSIGSRFTDGRTFEDLIEGLQSGAIVPLSAGFLTLTAVNVDGKNFCMNNRRLWCLQEYQKTVNKTVCVRLRITKNKDPEIDKFLRHYTTIDSGGSVRRRAPPRVEKMPPPAPPVLVTRPVQPAQTVQPVKPMQPSPS